MKRKTQDSARPATTAIPTSLRLLHVHSARECRQFEVKTQPCQRRGMFPMRAQNAQTHLMDILRMAQRRGRLQRNANQARVQRQDH